MTHPACLLLLLLLTGCVTSPKRPCQRGITAQEARRGILVWQKESADPKAFDASMEGNFSAIHDILLDPRRVHMDYDREGEGIILLSGGYLHLLGDKAFARFLSQEDQESAMQIGFALIRTGGFAHPLSMLSKEFPITVATLRARGL